MSGRSSDARTSKENERSDGMARKAKQAPLRTRSGIVLDEKKVDELVREIEDDATEWAEPLPKSQWPIRAPRSPVADG
jgi:hypothetical protein